MDFDLNQEQERIRGVARGFAARELEPAAADVDRTAAFPSSSVERMASLGLLGVAVPVEHGGAGLDVLSLALVLEELAAACASSAAIAAANNALFCAPLLRFGTEAQLRDVLAPAASGKALGCLALNEGAHDGGPMLTLAEKQVDGSFVLQGSKSFVTLGPVAAHALVVARSEGAGSGHVAFLVRRGTAGLSFSGDDARTGARAARSCSLVFDGVRVPPEQVVGGEGSGLAVAAVAEDVGRVAVAAQAVGIARGAFERAAARVKERKAAAKARGGGDLQAVEFSIADMATSIDAARLLVLRAARAIDAGADARASTSIARLFASEAAATVTHRAVQIFGREGVTAACDVDRYERAARVTEIDGGAGELLRGRIAELEA